MTNWESMSSQELKERLKTELAPDAPDRETVMAIMDELEKREPVKEIPLEVLAQWEAIKTRKKAKTTRCKPVWKAAIAAVLAVALLGIVPTAMGKGNIFQTISRWTKDLFCFGETESTEFVFQTDHPGLQELYDTVTALGVTENVVPTWLPEGYETQTIKKLSSPSVITVYGVFTNGEMEIQVSISVSNEETEKHYQKDDAIVDIQEYAGIKTYIVSNNEKYCAMWQRNNVEATIYTDEKDDVYKMVKSIYRSVDQ